MNEEIKKLFKKRDDAVEKQNRKLFLSTQIAEIDYGSTEGYLAIKHLQSQILYTHDESEIEKVVFVKETYSPPDKDPYSAFPAYFIVQTIKGWKIYRVK